MADGHKFEVAGHSEWRVDGLGLVTGRPVFAGDLQLPGSLHVALLHSPHPHARIRSIDTRRAEQHPGVVAVLTHRNTPTTRYTTAGQGFPEPSPYDMRMFDTKVRFVGDRVAAVAAESKVAALQALDLIDVDYEDLPAVLSLDAALAPGAPVVHDETDAEGIHDAAHNISGFVEMTCGDLEHGFAESDVVVETTCETHYAQHATTEPHVALSWLDADGRLVVYSSTQVPFHARRIIARVLDLPAHRVRVIKPRIGGGFGAKQEVLVEDLVALVTLRTGRPSRIEYSRAEEFIASRTRHPMRVTVKVGARDDGSIHALRLDAISNTGAYGTHGLTVVSNTGSKSLPMYNTARHVAFTGTAVYTNLPVAGAYRGYGATQGQFALEVAIDELAEQLGVDPLELRRRNHIRSGGTSPVFEALGEGREGVPQTITSCELPACMEIAAERIGWASKRASRRRTGSWVHGVGMSIHMQGSGIPGVDLAAATIKMNDDGSFNLLVGATDLGTGSDTVLAQIAAENLGVPLDHIIVTSSDTDTTPFDEGAYASSTTYVSGNAVQRAAAEVRGQILGLAAELLDRPVERLELAHGRVSDADGHGAAIADIAIYALYGAGRTQPGATASYVGDASPPPFLASFAEVAVDTDTGRIKVLRYVAAVDCGTAINPHLAEGQVEGAIVNGLSYALTERLLFTERGEVRNPDLARYKILGAADLPPIEVVLVDAYEPTGPLGAKSVAEIGINAPLPTLSNAVFDAIGIRLTQPPFTAERVWAALHGDDSPTTRQRH
ncbi:MAG: xanthine dehydrogenase family protein molybdopterin-binding subunit [Acidimicrobiia bacterium]